MQAGRQKSSTPEAPATRENATCLNVPSGTPAHRSDPPRQNQITHPTIPHHPAPSKCPAKKFAICTEQQVEHVERAKSAPHLNEGAMVHGLLLDDRPAPSASCCLKSTTILRNTNESSSAKLYILNEPVAWIWIGYARTRHPNPSTPPPAPSPKHWPQRPPQAKFKAALWRRPVSAQALVLCMRAP